jgi:hypothetical protein
MHPTLALIHRNAWATERLMELTPMAACDGYGRRGEDLYGGIETYAPPRGLG